MNLSFDYAVQWPTSHSNYSIKDLITLPGVITIVNRKQEKMSANYFHFLWKMFYFVSGFCFFILNSKSNEFLFIVAVNIFIFLKFEYQIFMAGRLWTIDTLV